MRDAYGNRYGTSEAQPSFWSKIEPYFNTFIKQLFPGTTLPQSQNIPTTKMSLNLNNTTTVQLDGRVIATIIKRYLAEDLVRMTSGYGNSKKDFVL